MVPVLGSSPAGGGAEFEPPPVFPHAAPPSYQVGQAATPRPPCRSTNGEGSPRGATHPEQPTVSVSGMAGITG